MRTLSLVDSKVHVLVTENEFLRRRVLRALARRERYRYVEPEVHIAERGFLITSPCCSRNVAPDGSVIDIARIEKLGNSWLLYSRDHKLDMWILHDEYNDMDKLLDVLCVDADRVFWP